MKATQAQIDDMEAQIVQANVAIETARVNLAYARVWAPIDFMVLLVTTQQGQIVNAAQTAPTIVVMGRVDQMAVRAEISEIS